MVVQARKGGGRDWEGLSSGRHSQVISPEICYLPNFYAASVPNMSMVDIPKISHEDKKSTSTIVRELKDIQSNSLKGIAPT